MQLWKQLRFVVLVAALAGLAAMLYLRGNPFGLGGRPATLETAYVTEEAWVVTEILQAVTELAGPLADDVPLMSPRTTAPGHVYEVDGGRGLRVDLAAALWTPDAFVPVAEAVLAGAPAPRSTAPLDVYRTLAVDPGSEPIVAAAALADARLAASPADGAAHEAAALAVGAFALRESAGRYYSDVRSALSRMTAHLAFARSSRHGGAVSTDGRLAHAVLLTLANHQAKALAALTALPEPTDAETRAWRTALRLRLTQDWRLIDDPLNATRLEQLQYFRARRVVLPGLSGSEELLRMGIEELGDVDWQRIVRSHDKSVGDAGDFVADALDAELDEVRRVRRAMGLPDGSADAEAIAALDADDSPAGGRARVLPWGVWAAQIQRHLANYTAEVDRHLRHRVGSLEAADAAKVRLDGTLGGLRLFPLGALGRTAGPAGGLGDFEYLRQGIALASTAPPSMQYAQWAYLGLASQYEPLSRRMPTWSEWFTPATARMPYEAELRAAGDTMADGPTLTALAAEAPFDYLVVVAALRARFGAAAPPAEVERLLGPRFDYDVRALSQAVYFTRGEAQLGYQQRACDLTPRECVDLGGLFVGASREADASRAYERAFADPDYDTVSLANTAPWLVDYYERTGRGAEALALAERGAGSGALLGLQSVGRLYERRGRFDEAELVAIQASRYANSGEPFGFYYRAVHGYGRDAYRGQLDALRAELFPAGMQPAPTALAAAPSNGVFIFKDSEFSRRHGVQAGDVIVGIEGWKVDDQRQYRAASATALTGLMKLSVWRGQVRQVEVATPARLMGVEFRNHPMKGWTD